MAFDIDNIKEVGGPGNSQKGGHVFSLWSDTDTLATMLAASYLDDLAFKLNVRDIVFLTGTEGVQIVQVVSISTADVVVVGTVGNTGAPEIVAAAGAVDITSAVSNLTLTGTDAITLADGAVGQVKTIVAISVGTSHVLTPATFNSLSTITFNLAGDSVTLLFGSAGWTVIGQNSVVVA